MILKQLEASGTDGSPVQASDRGVAKTDKHADEPIATLMFVESNVRMQNLVRDGLKRSGYRVLVTGDPQRALDRFSDFTMQRPDGIIISTNDLGNAALEAFNTCTTNEETQAIPAVLILGEEHQSWRDQIETSDHHRVLSMPLRFNQLRQTLIELLK